MNVKNIWGIWQNMKSFVKSGDHIKLIKMLNLEFKDNENNISEIICKTLSYVYKIYQRHVNV